LKKEERRFARRGEIKIIVGDPIQFRDDASEEDIAKELQQRVAALN
jgi:lysophospholipid acyltransferase (LPLAT)-like uncharacterized protein